jgi:hypothetical protein
MFNFLVVDIEAISELNAEGIELSEENKEEWLVSRLNAILSAHGNGEYIYQKNYQWFISYDGKEEEFKSGILWNYLRIL